jgi:hypothetical protein
METIDTMETTDTIETIILSKFISYHIISPIPCDLRPLTCTLQPAPCNLHPASSDLHPVTCTLHPATCDLHLVICTLRPATCDLHPVTCDDGEGDGYDDTHKENRHEDQRLAVHARQQLLGEGVRGGVKE